MDYHAHAGGSDRSRPRAATAGDSSGWHARSLIYRGHHSHPGAGAVAAAGAVVARSEVTETRRRRLLPAARCSCMSSIHAKEHRHGSSAGRSIAIRAERVPPGVGGRQRGGGTATFPADELPQLEHWPPCVAGTALLAALCSG